MKRFMDGIKALVSETVDMGLACGMINRSVQAIGDGNMGWPRDHR